MAETKKSYGKMTRKKIIIIMVNLNTITDILELAAVTFRLVP